MKNRFQNRQTLFPLFVFLFGILLFLFGVILSLSARPALANPPYQGGYPVDTVTATEPGYPVVTNTPTATVSGAATATRTVTPTSQGGTLPPPSVSGTPTVLFPVTGADFTSPSGQSGIGVWVALWLLGLLMIGYGLRTKLGKQK
jgi:hypothetical protein